MEDVVENKQCYVFLTTEIKVSRKNELYPN